MSLYDVKDEDLLKVYDECVQKIEHDLKHRSHTYASLARDIGVGESALKQFVHRFKNLDIGTKIKRGAAFERIYVKYCSEPEIPEDRHISDVAKFYFYRQFQKIVGVSPSHNKDVSRSIFSKGNYLCFRISTDLKHVDISDIIFSNLGDIFSHGDESKVEHIWEFKHSFHEIDGDRISDGLAFSIKNTVYLIGDIGYGSGLDIIRFKSTSIDGPKFLCGFLDSIDQNLSPFSSNVVLCPRSLFDGQNGSSLLESGLMPIEELQNVQISGIQSFGEKLKQQLQDVGSESIVRIRNRYIL
jgi:hypothetical protein